MHLTIPLIVLTLKIIMIKVKIRKKVVRSKAKFLTLNK